MLIKEYTAIDYSVRQFLKRKGYKLIGDGINQDAYLEPKTGLVLKVFGAEDRPPKGLKDFNNDQKMFFYFYKYCKSHQYNPYLPKFYGAKGFIFEERLYIQIRQERLFKLSGDLFSAFTAIFPNQNKVEGTFESHIELAKQYWKYDDNTKFLKLIENPKQYKMLKGLFATAQKLYKMGKTKGFRWDLHDENVMVRKDNFPVIIDPWVVGSYS